MMKTISYFIGICSVFALASCNPEAPDTGGVDKPAAKTQKSIDNIESRPLNIAFIFGDTINDKYNFLIDARKELESEEKVMEERVNRKIQKAENRYRELQQQSTTMSQADMQEAQLELQNLDLEIRQFQETLATDYRKRETELQKEYIEKIDDFLEEFNANGHYDMIFNYQRGGNVLWVKDSFDITDSVLTQLNDRYAKGMAEKKDAANRPESGK